MKNAWKRLASAMQFEAFGVENRLQWLVEVKATLKGKWQLTGWEKQIFK